MNNEKEDEESKDNNFCEDCNDGDVEIIDL